MNTIAPYLEGCPTLPDALAAAAAGTPTPEEEEALGTAIRQIAAEIRRRREAWMATYGLAAESV